MTKKTIWVIDDDAIYQIIINKIIQRSEMFSTISSFKNGKEAIDALNDTLENNEYTSRYYFIGYQYAYYGWMGIYGRNGTDKI